MSHIRFENVSFKYPGTNTWVLKNINLEICLDEIVGIVGQNGSGKTTLIKLLCRFYDPTEGKIWIDGKNITTFSIEDYQKHISTIFQDYVQYETNVIENIGFGNTAQITNINKIKDTAIDCDAHGFINRLHDGYESFLGRWLEEGTNLSGGEWQKIAISRAIFKDVEVIILDEPTASLDPQSEYNFYKQAEKIFIKKIAIIISHRFSTMRLCDKIIVMNEGKIEEIGTHNELINNNRMYAQLYNTQLNSLMFEKT